MLFVSTVVHELAHLLMAYACGATQGWIEIYGLVSGRTFTNAPLASMPLVYAVGGLAQALFFLAFVPIHWSYAIATGGCLVYAVGETARNTLLCTIGWFVTQVPFAVLLGIAVLEWK